MRSWRVTGGTSTTSWCAAARTLMQPEADERELVVLGAAKLGETRLIDNLEIDGPA